MNKTAILVSHPNSGFSIGLPVEARELLGGVDTKVIVGVHENDDRSFDFSLYPDEHSLLDIKNVSRASRPSRIQWKAGVYAPIDYHFAPIEVPWKWEDGKIKFSLPISKLRVAHTKSKAEPKVGLLEKVTAKPDKPKQKDPPSGADKAAAALYEFVRANGFHGPEAKDWDERSEEHKAVWRTAVVVVTNALLHSR